jgi:hypothetical protein
MKLHLALIVTLALALVGGLQLAPRNEIDAAASEWRSAGSLLQARAYTAAVPLQSGKILILDGLDGVRGVMSDGAELFDPRSGRVEAILGRPSRIHATTTTLQDGRILVVGGTDRSSGVWQDQANVEIFDPRAQEWRAASALRVARGDHGATLLSDGRVLIAGGHRGIVFLDSVEIYDPRTNAWTDAARLPKPRAQFTIATLLDGRVLVAGGFEAGLPSRTSVLYDPRTNEWSDGPELSVERALHADVLLPNGDVLLVGGQRAAAGTAERYDFKRNAFVYAGSLSSPRMLPFAVALRDGRIITGGGLPRPAQILDHFAPSDTTEVYDPAANTWSPGPKLVEPIAFAGVVVDRDGAWLFGGAAENEEPRSVIQRFR